MSRFSGKCDLYDHIMMEKMYDKGGYFDSDELECFKIFKEKTGGKLYQHRKVNVNFYNQEELAKQNEHFSIIEQKNKISDKRTKLGYREKTAYTYNYFGTEYKTLEALNKNGGVFVTIELPFENIFDLIPYYPYLTSVCACNEGKETIYITTESFVESELQDHLNYSCSSNAYNYYCKELQQHYVELIEKYGLENLR